ncbi:MAG: hypothetical protein OES47_03905 [Acidobacteriota bacterium]|nr:hypothetical protein [Acidobacteriota bacterium]
MRCLSDSLRISRWCSTLTLLTAVAALAGGDNPPADGFDVSGSDARAIALADSVMERMGGRKAWDDTRFITWKFFGRRSHVWDKHTGDIRVEGVERESGNTYLILMNLHSMNGRAWLAGKEATGEELDAMLDRGEAAWINDSYWLVMPYKLKDSGVTLTYVGEQKMEDGRLADIVRLTFTGVGRTPENKYHVAIARDSGLVEQWAFFADADDAEPRFRTPWHDWKRHGNILLSANRGDNGHTHIAVLDKIPETVLTSPEQVELTTPEIENEPE